MTTKATTSAPTAILGTQQTARVIAWNIRASMTERVMDSLCQNPDADVFVLSEYRVPKAGDILEPRLTCAGWPHVLKANIPTGLKGVAIYSRTPLEPAPELLPRWKRRGNDLSQWIVAAYVPAVDLSILGVYVPYPDGPLKEAVWHELAEAAERHRSRRLLITGDFNSAWPHEADTGRGYTTWWLREMTRVAKDLWAQSNPTPTARDQITWEGPNGKGNRIDFAFGTEALAADLAHVTHTHELRTTKVSDHSQLVIDLFTSKRGLRS